MTKTVDNRRRRGRPALSDAEKQVMKDKIAKTAQRLFQAQGYGEVSMRKIAKEIGCTPMALYSYYDRKIDILRTLWGAVFEDLFANLETLKQRQDPAETLTALATGYVHYWLDHADEYRLVFMADGVSQPEVSVFLDQPDITHRYALFADAIMKASKATPTEAQTKLKLDLLICVLHGIAHNHITISGYPWSPPEDMVRAALGGLLTDRGTA